MESAEIGNRLTSREVTPRGVIRVRVSPRSLAFHPRSAQERDRQIADYDAAHSQLKAQFLAEINTAVEAGEFELPVDSERWNLVTQKAAADTMAHALAVNELSLRQALAGMGMGGVDSFVYHGRQLEYIPDDEVDFGSFVIEGDDDGSVLDELRLLALQ